MNVCLQVLLAGHLEVFINFFGGLVLRDTNWAEIMYEENSKLGTG